MVQLPLQYSIATIIHQSGQIVPAWMLALPKPSKVKKRLLQRKPVERKSVGIVAGRGVGKGDAVRRMAMIAGSKRRKVQGEDKKVGGKGKEARGEEEVATEE